MPPLFFAVAAASSEASAGVDGRLALLPGSGIGWRSSRCCEYPQELLLQLERGAEVHEVEVAVPSDFAPSEVEIHLSRGGAPVSLAGDLPFDHAATLRFDSEAPARRAAVLKRARAKLGVALCSGQVRVIVREPASSSSSNPYRQVGLDSMELWGYEDTVKADERHLEGGVMEPEGAAADEVSAVLMELGIPLSVVPFDEDMIRGGDVDADTSQLIGELRRRQPQLVQEGRLGEAQQLAEQMQQLGVLGAELRRLRAERDKLLAAERAEEANQHLARIRGIEQFRMGVGALYETDWWLERMSMPRAA